MHCKCFPFPQRATLRSALMVYATSWHKPSGYYAVWLFVERGKHLQWHVETGTSFCCSVIFPQPVVVALLLSWMALLSDWSTITWAYLLLIYSYQPLKPQCDHPKWLFPAYHQLSVSASTLPQAFTISSGIHGSRLTEVTRILVLSISLWTVSPAAGEVFLKLSL